MNAGSLFSGVGGLDLGVGVPPAWFCEYDKHCRTVLERHWPGVPVYTDVREMDESTPRVDVLHGGYPCQPFSVAGKRGAAEDPRHLWPEFARLIRILRPGVAVLENVAGHLGLGFADVLSDLAGLGFDAEWGVVRASDVGAPHGRARLFVIARNTDRERLERRNSAGRSRGERTTGTPSLVASADAANDRRARGWASRQRGPGSSDVDWGTYELAIRRWERTAGPAPRPTDDRGRLMPEFVEWMMGLPIGWTDGMARTNRLRMLGNAVVPQQARLALDLLGFAA